MAPDVNKHWKNQNANPEQYLKALELKEDKFIVYGRIDYDHEDAQRYVAIEHSPMSPTGKGHDTKMIPEHYYSWNFQERQWERGGVDIPQAMAGNNFEPFESFEAFKAEIWPRQVEYTAAMSDRRPPVSASYRPDFFITQPLPPTSRPV